MSNSSNSPATSPACSPADGRASAVAQTERITNGAFASGANWTLGAGWLIAAGVASDSLGLGAPGGACKQVYVGGQIASGTSVTLQFDITTNPLLDLINVYRVSDAGGTIDLATIYIVDAAGIGHISATFTLGANSYGVAIASQASNGGYSIDNVSVLA